MEGLNSRNQRLHEQAISSAHVLFIAASSKSSSQTGALRPSSELFLSPKVPDAASEPATTKLTMLVTVGHDSDPRLAFHAGVVTRSRNSRRTAAGSTSCSPLEALLLVLGTAPRRPRGRRSECEQGTPTTWHQAREVEALQVELGSDSADGATMHSRDPAGNP